MNERKFFAASNSRYGFTSYYDKIFDNHRLEHIYVIKGGPGTGKSSFMRKIALFCEERGLDVTYIYCSSDPGSLDGIIIDGLGVALLDGTAPHTFEPRLAGASEEIINLGQSWNSKKLSEKRRQIEMLSELKSACYKRAYQYLDVYGKLADIADSLVLPCFKREKAEGAVKRLLRYVDDGEKFSALPLLRRAVSMRGECTFDTYEKEAVQRYYVSDFYGSAHLFLGEAVKEAERKKLDILVSYDPIEPAKIDGVFFNDMRTVLVVGDAPQGEKAINMRRFVDYEEMSGSKKEIKRAKELQKIAYSGALDALDGAREYHFALEKIYGDAMDFSKNETLFTEVCAGIFEK